MSEQTRDERRGGAASITLAEKILVPITLAVVVGWLLRWFHDPALFKSPFSLLSFFPCLLIDVLIILRYFDKFALPEKVDRLLLSILTLLPFLGFLIRFVGEMSTVGKALTVVGSIATAYIAATTYWRKRIPQIALDPLRQAAGEAEPRAEARAEEPAEAPREETSESAGAPPAPGEATGQAEEKDTSRDH